MKQFLGTITALIFTVIVQAQISINGVVVGAGNQPLNGATVLFETGSKKLVALTNKAGYFEFKKISPETIGKLIVEYVGKKTDTRQLEINHANITVKIELEESGYFLEPLEISSIRAADRSPFTKTDLGKSQIEVNNLGQDLPFVLNQTPSVVVNSDAGNGVGYTGIRIRGSDASRINVTLNGIPYNDAESQGAFFVDLPDITSSANSIQIQRGVGTSTNGAGAFGATINLSTNEFNEKAYGEINNGYGSFNTWKHTVKAGTGLINDHFTIDARLSSMSSDGYIDRASSDLRSFYLSTAYFNKKTSIRFNILSGKEKTYQAWYGVPQDLLEKDRTFNPAGTEKPGAPYDNQTDNYQQDHYQLFFNHAFTDYLSLNVASFLTHGKGYYEEYKAGQKYSNYNLANFVLGSDTLKTTDLVRQRWLDNYFYGQTFSLQYKKNRDEISFGGSWTRYDGKHYGTVIWANAGIPKDYKYYDNPALKTDLNFYAKWLHPLNNYWNVFGDLQYRHVMHEMDGFTYNPGINIKRSFDFVNPKAGISYVHNGWNAYLSYAVANKEPNRDDFEASPLQQPKKEMLQDFELGIQQKKAGYNWGVNLYYMLYKNQLVLTGKMNDVGAYTRVNTPDSYRLGIELQGSATISPWLIAAGNLTFSKNKIKEFTEYLDDYDNGKQIPIQHQDADISFSPSIIGSGILQFLPLKNLELDLVSKYVGNQYLDNTQNNARMLDAYYTQDIKAIYTVRQWLFKEWKFIGQVNNLFNKKYESNGATYPYISGGAIVSDNYYFPMAGTNFMVAVNISL